MIKRGFKSFTSVVKILKQSIVIETMKTPNPNFIKFIPINNKVLGD